MTDPHEDALPDEPLGTHLLEVQRQLALTQMLFALVHKHACDLTQQVERTMALLCSPAIMANAQQSQTLAASLRNLAATSAEHLDLLQSFQERSSLAPSSLDPYDLSTLNANPTLPTDRPIGWEYEE